MPDLHLECGSSNADRRENCPGSVKLSRGMPNESSAYANAGTAKHYVMEEMHLTEEDPRELARAHVGHHVSDHTLTEDDITDCLVAWDAWEELSNDLDIVEFEPEVFGRMAENIGGTGDIVGVDASGELVLIGDYKFGKGHQVFAEENKQLMFLAMCVLFGESSCGDMLENVKDVVVAIIQPNERDLPVLRTWRTTKERIESYRRQHDLIMREVEAPRPRLSLGDHCRFCPAAPVCPEKRGIAFQALKLNPQDLATLSESLALAEQLKGWHADVMSAAKQQLELGQPVEGYKLVAGQNRRYWAVDAEKIFRALQRKIGKKHMVETKILSPAQMTKKIKALGKDVDLEQFIETRSSGTAVVPESSPKPAVNPLGKIGQAFARLT